MKKVLKQTLSVLLAVVMTFTITLPAFAQESVENLQQSPEYVYYSDLFYNYSFYLKASTYLRDYNNDNQEVLNQIYDDFMNSPSFWLVDIKHSLSAATNITEWVKLISDATGFTGFTYNNALDSANVQLASSLLGETNTSVITDIEKTYGVEQKWMANINKLMTFLDNLNTECDFSSGEYTYEEIFEYVLGELETDTPFNALGTATYDAFEGYIWDNFSKICELFKTAEECFEIAKGFVAALMIENFRLSYIDNILSVATEGSMIHDGMTRLKSQLTNGFVEYFFHNYLDKKIVNEVSDGIVTLVEQMLLSPSQLLMTKLVTSAINLASCVVFDVICDVPDIDDLTTQLVLKGYANDLYFAIENKIDTFSSVFDSKEILNFEDLVSIYVAANNAAMNTADKIKLSSNEELLENIKNKYSGVCIYTEYINEAKNLVYSSSNLVHTSYGKWSKQPVVLTGGADQVESGYVYANDLKADFSPALYDDYVISIKDSDENQNVSIDGTVYMTGEDFSFTVPKNTTFSVSGDVQLSVSDISFITNYFYNYGTMNVGGKLTVTGAYSYYWGGANGFKFTNHGYINVEKDLYFKCNAKTVINNGYIKCNGNITLHDYIDFYNNNYIYGHSFTTANPNSAPTTNFYSTEDSIMELTGNINIDDTDITFGNLKLCGTEQQSIKGVVCENLNISNPQGIRYESNLTVYNKFILNENPIDANGNYANCSSTTVFDSVSDYKRLNFISKTNFILSNDLTADITGCSGGSITIPSGSEVKLNGSINLTAGSIVNNGKFTVTGDLKTYGEKGIITNNNELIICGKLTIGTYDNKPGKLIMNNSSAILTVSGNLIFASLSSVSAGKLILNGNTKQTVKFINVPTIVIENNSEDGVVFNSTISPSVLFDHKNNNFTLYNNGTNSIFVDYDKDGMLDNVDPYPTVGQKTYIDEYGTEWFYVAENYDYHTILGVAGYTENVIIPKEIDGLPVKHIDAGAFSETSKFKHVTISENIEFIDAKAFYNCVALESVYFYCPIMHIADDMFYGCTNLSIVDLPDVLVSTGRNSFRKCSNLQSISFPEGFTTIGDYSFYDCEMLANVDLPESLMLIGNSAFCNCILIKNIDLPDGVDTIKSYAFSGCSLLENIRLPEKLTTLENSIFYKCSTLKTIDIGAAEPKISSFSFNSFVALENYAVDDSNDMFAVDNGILFSKDKTILYKYPKHKGDSYVLPRSVVELYYYSFENTDIMSIDLGENLEKICNGAFEYSTLNSVMIPASVKSIGNNAFSETPLTSVSIPEGVVSIGMNAFSNTLLKSVVIPKTIEKLSYGTFSECKLLTEVDYYAINCTITGFLFNGYVFPSTITNFNIGDNVESLPRSLIEKGTFTELVIPGSVTLIHKDAFDNFNYLRIYAYPNSCAKEFAEINEYEFVPVSCGNCSISDWTVTMNPTCRYVGNRYGDCDVCGTVVSEIMSIVDHSFTQYVSDNNATCSKNSTQTAKCDFNCGKTNTIELPESILPHNYDDDVVTKEPTCTETGVKTFTCECGDSYTEEIEMLDHEYESAVTAPTCTEQGFTTYTCSCGDSYVADYVDATGHTDEVIPGYGATCTETGLTDGVKCSVCGEVTSEQEIIPVIEHDDTDSDGYCDECGEDLTANCSHSCHSSGFVNFFWKIINFLQKLFGVDSARYCECGVDHWA